MKAQRTTKKPAPATFDVTARLFKAPEGFGLAGLHAPAEPRAYRRYMSRLVRRAKAVRAAYDNAPAGANEIAAIVWRTLRGFQPKPSGREMRDLIPSEFRNDVTAILSGKIWEVRQEEIRAEEAADDARRAKRQGRKGAAHG